MKFDTLTPISPADFFASWASLAMGVLPWVFAGVLGSIGLFFAVLGIKKGLGVFFEIVRGAGENRSFRVDRSDVWNSEYDSWHAFGLKIGLSDDKASELAGGRASGDHRPWVEDHFEG